MKEREEEKLASIFDLVVWKKHIVTIQRKKGYDPGCEVEKNLRFTLFTFEECSKQACRNVKRQPYVESSESMKIPGARVQKVTLEHWKAHDWMRFSGSKQKHRKK